MANASNPFDHSNDPDYVQDRLREMYNESVFRDLILDPAYTLVLSTDSTGSRLYWSFMPVCKTEPVIHFGSVYSGMLSAEARELGFDA